MSPNSIHTPTTVLGVSLRMAISLLTSDLGSGYVRLATSLSSALPRRARPRSPQPCLDELSQQPSAPQPCRKRGGPPASVGPGSAGCAAVTWTLSASLRAAQGSGLRSGEGPDGSRSASPGREGGEGGARQQRRTRGSPRPAPPRSTSPFPRPMPAPAARPGPLAGRPHRRPGRRK